MIEIWGGIGRRNPNSCVVPPAVEIGIAESRGRVEGYESEGLRVTKVYNFFLNPPKLEALCNCTLGTSHGPALLVGVAEEDHEKFLLRLKSRLDRVGISLPTIEVRFEHLKIAAETHLGGRALPSVFNYCVNVVEGFLNCLHILPQKKEHVSILKDVSGIIKPCRMTLLLGPPSSGKTTLLLALAGELDKDLKVSGNVTYNGHGMHEFVPQRTAVYISQHDVHIPEMTVGETLAFSARCQGVGARYEMLVELSREKETSIQPDPDLDIYMKGIASESQRATFMTNYILKVLGLDGCADTLVGDQLLRGISGGQKKRVTTGEMLVGPSKALFMDEISTGLDSSTTYQIVNSIKQYVHILQGTAFISLLQPAPETYDLFDDIILLSDGQIVYQGPREHVLGFFESMGFRCSERKGVADFLQEVTSRKDQEQYWASRDEPYRFITVEEFSQAFQSFHVGCAITHELATPFDKTKSHSTALTTKKYGVKRAELFKACFSREFLLMKRNSFVYLFKLIQFSILSLITMTLFLRTEMHRDSVINGGIYAGALFFSLVAVMFNGMAELSMSIAKLRLVIRGHISSTQQSTGKDRTFCRLVTHSLLHSFQVSSSVFQSSSTSVLIFTQNPEHGGWIEANGC
ncbi:hypothetical protein ACLB2K_013898 [Fragaria x ananassa]